GRAAGGTVCGAGGVVPAPRGRNRRRQSSFAVRARSAPTLAGAVVARSADRLGREGPQPLVVHLAVRRPADAVDGQDLLGGLVRGELGLDVVDDRLGLDG